MCLPSGENATDQTEEVCPWRGFPTWPPICASQTQMVSSKEPDTICLPSGENATEMTGEVCPQRTCWFVGQSSSSPLLTLGIPRKSFTRYFAMTDLHGENGNADKYKCGVLLPMSPEKFSTNLTSSLINFMTSSYPICPCELVINMVAACNTTSYLKPFFSRSQCPISIPNQLGYTQSLQPKQYILSSDKLTH